MKKAPVKAKKKSPAKPKKVAPKAAPPAPKENFMMKLLKEKEAHLKHLETQAKNPSSHSPQEGHFHSNSHPASFSRVNLPRRRSAS